MPIRPENRNRYPQDWKLRSRFIRYYRAKNRCEWCGAKNGEPHPLTGSKVVLTVAHIFDSNPEAASLLNLAALCQKCHLGFDRKHHIAIGKLNRRKKMTEIYGDLFEPQIKDNSASPCWVANKGLDTERFKKGGQ